MSDAERFCDEKATIIVPGIALNYDGNMLESVGIGGEMFRRETPLSAENRLLRAENAKLREENASLKRLLREALEKKFSNEDKLQSENEKLRKLALCLLTCASDGCLCDSCPLNGGPGIWEFEDFCDGLLDLVHELRIEVG
jgi:hypothetical protein